MAEDTEKIKEIKKDIKKYGAFEDLAKTEAGQELVSSLESDFIGLIDKIVLGYTKMGTENLFPCIAELKITLNQLRIFYRAADQKRGALLALKEEEKRETEGQEES